MSYNLNTEAYKLFIQIEVGLREFLIQSIQETGVHEWTNNFLGNVQRDTINEVVKRIGDAYKNNVYPQIVDQYYFKLDRAKRGVEFLASNLSHPFYYLNWTDLESLLRMKNNAALIDKHIGKINRETIIETLKPLSHIRNDVAHSRFISDDSYKFLKASFEIISVLIPNFQGLIDKQTTENTLSQLINRLKRVINIIELKQLLAPMEIEEINETLFECKNSFWLNSENLILVMQIKELIVQMELYKMNREKQGGLLGIQNIKSILVVITSKIKSTLNG